MYMKSLVSLAVLGAMSAVATAGDLVVFDKPNESYTVDGLNKYGATIKASDITITNTTYNGTSPALTNTASPPPIRAG